MRQEERSDGTQKKSLTTRPCKIPDAGYVIGMEENKVQLHVKSAWKKPAFQLGRWHIGQQEKQRVICCPSS